jgi:hypothetical protein|tara:strand:+ start:372 stop:947 length:576 start_codon:yes stop_codon:yes gene_type:complete
MSSIKNKRKENMPKMTKYQLEHFEKKVDRRFDPLIKEQELLIKQYRTEATKRIVGKLAKKMGADKVLDAFRKAEENLNKARQDARTFFVKKAKDEKKNINSYQFDREEKLSVSDCEEQMRDWAKELVDIEIRKRPEGEKLAQLEAVKQKAVDTVFESGTPDDLIKALDQCTQKIGLTWVVDTSNIKQITSN